MRNLFKEMRSPITRLGDMFVECKWEANELTKLKNVVFARGIESFIHHKLKYEMCEKSEPEQHTCCSGSSLGLL